VSTLKAGDLTCTRVFYKPSRAIPQTDTSCESNLTETEETWLEVVRAVGESLEQGSYTDPSLRAARFCKNLLKHFSALWTFLENDDLEPTNNHVERCLRHLVIWRKKYFSTQSVYGSEYVARTASLIMTAKLQKNQCIPLSNTSHSKSI